MNPDKHTHTLTTTLCVNTTDIIHILVAMDTPGCRGYLP